MRATRSRLIATIIMTLSIAVLAAVPSLASGSRLDSPDEARYIGWAYVSNSAPTEAWKWSSTGWTRTTFAAGTVVWAHPYGAAGWEWAWRNNAWYAVRSQYLQTWRCGAPATTYSVTQLSTLHRTNSAASQSYGVVPAGASVTRLCSNSFTDANEAPGMMYCMAIGCGPTEWILVKAQPMPACMYPKPGEPMCMIAMPVDGFEYKTGYIALPRPGFGAELGGYRGG